MLDFNSKKEILGRLRRKGQKNIFMFVPCTIAAFFVKAWYAFICRADMVLSDKNGDLLGIKGLGKKEKDRSRKDDIVYVRKPFLGRFVSAVLAMSLTMMLMPAAAITVIAVTKTTVTVQTPDGSSEEYRIDGKIGDLTYLYKDVDYQTAKLYTVYDIKYKVSDRAVRVEWKYDDKPTNVGDLVGFHVKVTQASDTEGSSVIYDQDILVDTASFVVISDGLVKNSQITAEIYPIIELTEWSYFGSVSAGDTIVEDGKDTFLGDGGGRKFRLDDKNCEGTNVLRGGNVDFNTKIDIPVVTVNGGDDVTYSSKIEITWTPVNVSGGNLSSEITGYNLYRKVGNGSFEPYKRDLPPTLTSFTDTDIMPGIHYQYFVEAYRIVWGGSDNGNNQKYNESNLGLVTSSGVSVESDGDGKFGSVYSGYERHLYVAPLAPSITVEPSSTETKNTINVKSDPNGNIYNGFYIFRTIGEKPLSLEDARKVTPDLEDEKFGEWLYNMFVKGEYKADFAEYEPVSKGQFNTSASYTYEDLDIISKQTYCYYVVSFIMKGNTPIFSRTVAYQTSSLNIQLDPPVAIIPTKGDGQTTLTWDPVPGAQGYEIEIKMLECYLHGDPSKCRTEEFITQVRNLGNVTTFLHNYLYNNDRYSYRVRAYKNVQSVVDGKILDKTYGSWSFPANVTVGVPLSQPLNVDASTVDGAITVTWEDVPGADTYTLFWENLTDGSDGFFEGLTDTTYTHTNLINDQRYTYWVVAYKHIDGDSSHETPQEIPSGESNAVTLKVGFGLNVPQDVTVETEDGETTVTWSDVDGAEGYILQYRRPGESWADYKDSSDLHNVDLSDPGFNHTRLNNGDTYEYRVIAYKTVSGERVYSEPSIIVSIKVGDILDAPKDFAVTTTDGTANLTWTASPGAEGYMVYAYSAKDRRMYSYDVSQPGYNHTNLINGDTWIYYVVAYKTVNGERTYSPPTISISVNIGVSMTAAVDLTATPGNRQVVLNWSAVTGAQGYVVYLYNEVTMEYDPITVTSQTTYTHLGLTNGKNYRYMVAAYKDIGGERVYGEYSMPVTATPTTGSLTDIDRDLTIKGTAPYGISHGEYISASANHGAFDESVDVYFTTSTEATQTVRDVLKSFAGGLNSFIIYPFDISVYSENTKVAILPNNGYNVTITMPIPDRLIAYRDYISIVHIDEYADEETIEEDDITVSRERRLEVLPSAVLDIDNVWCVQFETSSFSPYAMVIYKDHISDIASGGGSFGGLFAGSFNSGVLLFTALPDIMPNNNKLRIVSGGQKRYRIKSIEKLTK